MNRVDTHQENLWIESKEDEQETLDQANFR